MIVKCEQCQTRFKIPDEKVTEKGVKVRCTKCQHTFRVTRDGTTSGSGQVPAAAPVTIPISSVARAEPDPFAKFGAGDPGIGESTRPGVYALGVEASRASSGPLQPSYAAQMDQPSGVFEKPTRVGSMPVAPAGRKPLQDSVTVPMPRPAASAAPFDFAAAMGAPPETTEPGQFDFGLPPLPGPQLPATDFPQENQQAPTQQHPQYDPLAAATSGNEGENTSPAAVPIVDQGHASASVFGPDGGDFFASTEPPPPVPPSSGPTQPHGNQFEGGEGEVQADTGMRGQLFDMPSAAPTQQIPAVTDGIPTQTEGVQLARLNLVSLPSDGTGPTDLPPPELPRRRLGGLVFNVVIASVLVLSMTVIGTVYLNDGKVELASFSWERLKTTFSSNSDWVTMDISNGLYETRNGRPVFFVRGELKNRTATPTRAKVRAEILDGNTSIRHADVWVGVTPSPEDLFAISTAEDLEHLLEKVGRSAADVPAGDKRGFLVPFYEYPPDLKGFRVKVTVIQSGIGETAAR